MHGPVVGNFDDFIRRIRSGDRAAAELLVRHFEPQIRLEIRHRLRFREARLRRVFDSMDICQSVLGDFFASSARGAFDLSDPSNLVRLLVGMATNKLAERVRYHQQAKRDVRDLVGLDTAVQDFPTTVEAPERIAAARELLGRCHGLLDDAERRVMEMRSVGEDWKSIAVSVEKSADACRKQYQRAIARLTTELGGDLTGG